MKKVVDLGKIKFSLKSILRHIKPALILGIPYYITSVYVVIDKTMLGLLCNQYAEVGYYEQSQKIISFSLAIITSLGTVFMPRLANEIAEKNSENVKRFLNYGLEIVLLLAAPLMIGLLCVGNMIVPWFFGSGYDKVGGLLMIFSPLALIMGITNFIGNQYFVASKNEKKLTLTISAGVIINLSLNFLLIPHLASYGAAIATVISEIVKLVMQVCYARDIIAIKELVHKFIQYILCAVIMGCIILMLRWKVFSVFTFSNTMIVMLVGVTVYFVLLLLLKNTFVVTVINKMKSKCLKQ